MPMWRCPHCSTPQPEASRCWVCKRSSTSCGTCRHFRRSVAAQLGYCGLDRRRLPLRGDEMRGCWEAVPSVPQERSAAPAQVAYGRSGRAFVPIDAEAAAAPAQPVPPQRERLTPADRSPIAPAQPPDPASVLNLWAELDA